MEIHDFGSPKTSDEEVEKRRRLEEATKILESGASAKELLAALAEADTARETKLYAESVTSNVLMPPDSSPCSLEEWERANLEHMIQEQRYGKDNGE